MMTTTQNNMYATCRRWCCGACHRGTLPLPLSSTSSPILQPPPKLNGNDRQQEMTTTATATRNTQSSKNQQPRQSTNNDREKLTAKPTNKPNQQPNASEGANARSLTVFFHPILHPVDLVPCRNGKYLAKWWMMGLLYSSTGTWYF